MNRDADLPDNNRTTLTNYLTIKVKDTGVGMTAQQVSKLFRNFTKMKKDRCMNKEGVGLGLMISKNLANALGGDIVVTSKESQGTCFTLIVPQ